MRSSPREKGRLAVPAVLASLGLVTAVLAAGPLPVAKAPVPAPRPALAGPKVDFNRDVRPILSDNCFACHGPDQKKRKAKLRLDRREAALRHGAIVPGSAGKSELVRRVSTDNPRQHMPPKRSGKHLTAQQVDTLRRWVDQGAPWVEHWAFVTPKRPALPPVKDAGWVRNPVDHFVLARLEAEGLSPSPEADKVMLLRRVTLDLTGLPPTPAEVDAFLADRSPGAYEKVVDRLLNSPRFGEHMARYWLDAARYGDTHGLHLDNYREMWPYRDWVVRAFNANMPYDSFVVEQLAGDLLPNPTRDRLVATGFNRCNVTTSEGGSIEEEVYVRNVVDRVDTTGTVLLGLSVGCARCHDHKYDPIRQKEYYQLFAYFNSLEGSPLDGNAARHPPVVKVPTPEQERALARLEDKANSLRQQMASAAAKLPYDDSRDAKESEEPRRAEYVWVDDDLPAGAKPAAPGGINAAWEWVTLPEHPVFSGKRSAKRSASGLSQQVFEGANPGLRVGAGDKLFAYVFLDPDKPPREVMLQWHTTNWLHRAYWGANLIGFGRDNSAKRRPMGPLPVKGKWVRLEVDAGKVGLKPGMVVNGLAFTQFGGTVYWDRAGIVTAVPQGDGLYDTLSAWVRAQKARGGAGLPKDVRDVLKVERGKRTEAQRKALREYFLANGYAKARAALAPLRKKLAEVDKERARQDKEVPATYVFKETPAPKQAYVLKRGEYDQRGEKVGRGTPAFLPPLPAKAPANRLGLARWVVAPENPLTARVAVNRSWQQVFGTGLVKTAEDFGAQGEPPSHPELLDWLAVEFREGGWDVKGFMRLLVTSATYRQTSKLTRDRLEKDPANRLLARGPRFRLDAEVLRDQALAMSGLLVERLGGPSVKPPQPRGLWEAVGYVTSNTAKFVPDRGVDRVHRRSVYTFWKRTAAPPQLTTFDAPSREACTVRRERTNTPLQALLTLNGLQYVESARALAERGLREGGAGVEGRVVYLFRLAVARAPDAGEVAELVSAYKDFLADFTHDESSARKLISLGETRPDPRFKPAELAAWTMVANVLLNLDEVMNKG
jgi:hypothetical protein